MAKRKGKSRSRIKDWQRRYDAGEEPEGTVARRQRVRRRGVKLPDRKLQAGQEATDDLPRAEGMVVGLFPGGAEVRTPDGVLLCQIAKAFRAPEGASPLAVGDNVTVGLTRSQHASQTAADKDRSDGMILHRELRETVLARPQPRSGKRRDEYDTDTFEKVIAANMDVLLVVAATCQPPLHHGLIDRFLIVAERGELTPVMVINKIDLAPADPELLAEFSSLGVRILLCSAATGEGLEDVQRLLAGKRSVLAGASGVGKSTLINALIPGAEAVTRTVRARDERGRHTTSSAVVYDVPDGGIVVDTPGIRELGLQMDAQLLGWYFPDFEEVAGDCKFGDCTHSHEPDCAVLDAVDAGRIPPARYERYLRLLETLEDV